MVAMEGQGSGFASFSIYHLFLGVDNAYIGE
jgi:hypothetical protein